MSPLWLFLIVPTMFVIGFGFGAVLSGNKHDEACANCKYKKEKSK